MSVEIHDVDDVTLCKFCYVMSVFVVTFFGLVVPLFSNSMFPLWPWLFFLFVVFIGRVKPVMIRPFYLIWMELGLALGWLNTRVILAIVFYTLIFPLGILAIVFRKNIMIKKVEKKIITYRLKKEVRDKTHMERPF